MVPEGFEWIVRGRLGGLVCTSEGAGGANARVRERQGFFSLSICPLSDPLGHICQSGWRPRGKECTVAAKRACLCWSRRVQGLPRRHSQEFRGRSTLED